MVAPFCLGLLLTKKILGILGCGEVDDGLCCCHCCGCWQQEKAKKRNGQEKEGGKERSREELFVTEAVALVL